MAQKTESLHFAIKTEIEKCFEDTRYSVQWMLLLFWHSRQDSYMKSFMSMHQGVQDSVWQHHGAFSMSDDGWGLVRVRKGHPWAQELSNTRSCSVWWGMNMLHSSSTAVVIWITLRLTANDIHMYSIYYDDGKCQALEKLVLYFVNNMCCYNWIKHFLHTTNQKPQATLDYLNGPVPQSINHLKLHSSSYYLLC